MVFIMILITLNTLSLFFFSFFFSPAGFYLNKKIQKKKRGVMFYLKEETNSTMFLLKTVNIGCT